MYCPFCSANDTKVIDSRLVSNGKQVRRRRECVVCSERFTTYEIAELSMPYVIKRNNTRQPFDEQKLRYSMTLALQKRPVSTDQKEIAIQNIIHKLHSTVERELSSRIVGEMVMDELYKLDQVAYIRFASVYKSFEDIKSFSDEIKKLRKKNNEKSSSRSS